MTASIYRAGIANLLLVTLVGWPLAPIQTSRPEQPHSVAVEVSLGNASSPAVSEAVEPSAPAEPVAAVVVKASQAGPPYVVFFPLVTRPAAPTATLLMSETFEGAFSGAWSLYSYSGPLTGEHKWGKRTCRPMNGSYSGMSYGGGAAGGALSCSDDQPDNVVSWMVSPTYNLVGATAAELRYHLWQNSEPNYDLFYALVSVDGTNFCGRQYSGNTQGWSEQVLDLTNVYGMGNLMGESAVQVAFVFISDYTADPPVYYDGAFIDDVSLLRCDGGACPIAPEDALGPLAMRGEACIMPGAVGP